MSLSVIAVFAMTAHAGEQPTTQPPAPTLHEWGLAILAVIGLIIGTVIFGPDRDTAQGHAHPRGRRRKR
jgi:hypothetical protein